MNFEMQKANMLADNIHQFIQFVETSYKNKNKSYVERPDKIFQLKLLVEEYKFQLLADELKRINEFSWNEKYTHILVERFSNGLNTISEYIDRNYEDLFNFFQRESTH